MSVTLLPAAWLAASMLAPALDIEAEAKRHLNLNDVDVQNLDVPLTIQPAFVEVDLEGLPFTLDIQPRSIRTAEYVLYKDIGGGVLVPEDAGQPRTFRGSILEDPGSVIAGSILDDGLHAKVVMSNGESYWIQPLVGEIQGARFGQHAVYSSDEANPCGFDCGTDTSGHIGTHTSDGGTTLAAGGQLEICELGLDADFEFYQQNSSDVQATSGRMELVINTMNLQYESQVSITHKVSAAIVRSDSNDPYTSSNASTLLNQFTNHWNNAQSGLRRDVAELFTGKNLGGIAGIAWLNGVCSNGNGYNVVININQLSCATDLSAHELGHNWGSGHCNCPNNTMNPSLTCSNNFTQGTRNTISNFANNAGCLDDRTILYEDDFESGNFAAGGWTISDSVRCKVNKVSAYSGSRGARLKKGGVGTGACTVGTEQTWIHTPSFSSAGCINVQLWFHGHFRKNELNCEFLDVQYSVNGGAWTSFFTLEKHAWDYYRVTLPGAAAGQNDVRIRFLTNAKGQAERAEIDNITVVGW